MTSLRTAPGHSLLQVLAVQDQELRSRLHGRLNQVESRLLECARMHSSIPVAEAAGCLIAAGGKRLRPLLALLGAEFGDREAPGTTNSPHIPGAIDAAVVAELVHVASLHHDDVMDEALTRHGVPSVSARWGSTVAVLTGDLLLARAGQLAAGLGQAAVRLHAQTATRLVHGQLLELSGPASPVDQVSHHFAVIADKSASLISAAVQLGALVAHAPEASRQALARFGEHLGVAFQLSDDLLDITSLRAQSGKQPGTDLATGVPTLPVILALADDRPQGRELRELLSDGALVEDRARRRALDLLRGSSAVDEARSELAERLDRARSALDTLPDLAARQALDSLCGFVAVRTR